MKRAKAPMNLKTRMQRWGKRLMLAGFYLVCISTQKHGGILSIADEADVLTLMQR